MKTTVYIVLSFIFALLLIQMLMAQPPGLPQTPSQAPIDGGLALLAAAGGGYALKKLRDRKKRDDGIDM